MWRVPLLVLVVAALGACGGGDAPPPSELTGLVVAIDGEGSDVRAFTLEAGLDEYEIRIVDGRDYGFDLAHLGAHLRDRLPVRCSLVERDGELYALEIEDA